MKIGEVNWNLIFLDELIEQEHFEQFKRVLSPIGAAIHAADVRINHALSRVNGDTDNEWYDAVVDDEAHFVEDLLGAVFVIAQGQIERIVTRTKKLEELFRRETKAGFPFSITRNDLLRLAPDGTKTAGVNAVEIIDAGGNLFKHGPQWDAWEDAGNWNQNKLRAIGCTPFTTGNFRRAATALGIVNYHEIDHFETVLWNWAEALREKIRPEFESRGLLKIGTTSV